MYRYMVLLWHQTDGAASKTADFIAASLHQASPHSWRKAWESPGITVLDAGEHIGRMQTYRLADNGGVVLGRLFRNDYTSVTKDLDPIETAACLKSKGQHLVDNYWGRYVAFLNDRSNTARYILRDPSGAFPCLYTKFQNVEIYFSDMQDAADLDFLNFTINWGYIKSEFAFPNTQKTRTGLNEVTELLAAECIEVTAFKRNKWFSWNPYEIAQTDIIEDPQEAAAKLRHTVLSVTGSLVAGYNSVMHHLGGLDSSILLACLAQAPNRPQIHALTNYTSSPLGEERGYSRQVADKYDVDLNEINLDYRRADLTRIFSFNKQVSPILGIECSQITNQALELTIQKEAEVACSGVGGDMVFYQMPDYFGVLDYVSCYGLFGKDWWRILLEASRYGRKSILTTARKALQERFTPEPCYDHVQKRLSGLMKRPLLNPEFLGGNDYRKFLHPFLTPDYQYNKGKYAHIRFSTFLNTGYYNPYDADYKYEALNPLLSQPVVELCLRIPVWVMTYGGVERGLARKAFINDLPTDIIRRYTKSSPLQHYVDVYHHNINLLRESLINGVLVTEGILLPDKLNTAIAREDPFLLAHPTELLGYLSLEAWTRSWLERREKHITPLEIAI